MTAQGIFDEPPGATPLGPDEAAGLIPTWIATREDLNRVEGDNIAQATVWTFVQHGPWDLDELLDESAVRNIHRRMFCDVWKWAGAYRTRESNIGVPPHAVPGEMKRLVVDVRHQISLADDLVWSVDEMAVRFHYRLVSIHPFPNGNGRHARLCADILAQSVGTPVFTWGGANLSLPGVDRNEYLAALRAADAEQDFARLIAFARS